MTAAPDPAILRLVFAALLSCQPRNFGTPSLGHLGCSDDNNGVQWNTWVDLSTGTCLFGVNLEGMAYDDWPIERLIERELRSPRLLEVRPRVSNPTQVEVSWRRDCWQRRVRLKILEADIAPTPLGLDQLTPEAWHQALTEAWTCLDEERGGRGRAKQTVTLMPNLRKEEKTVTPHLQFRTRLPITQVSSRAEVLQHMKAAMDLLRPLYDFVAERSRK